MLKLRRLYLDSVGNGSARFSKVMLDFTSPEATPLDTIVWLRNGGGKTSLLALYFSLFLTNKNDFLGARTDGRLLADYVLGGDTSHVVAEWETAYGPLVTGAVYEWPERRRPGEHAKHWSDLNRRWYVFTPSKGRLTLDGLPFRDGSGARLHLDQFMAQLRQVQRIHPTLNLFLASTPSDWHTALADRAIDPAVFRYQKDMNRGEGSIDELFRFTTPEAFIDFLIDLAVENNAPESLARRMAAVADKLQRRPQIELELTYCEGVASRLDPIGVGWQERERRLVDLQAAAQAASALADQLAAGEAEADTLAAAKTTGSPATARAVDRAPDLKGGPRRQNQRETFKVPSRRPSGSACDCSFGFSPPFR